MSQGSGVYRFAIRLGKAALSQSRESGLQSWVSGPRSDVLGVGRSALGVAPLAWSMQTTRMYAYPPHVLMSMPSLSPTMTQGNITQWKKKVGDQVSPGQVLAEVETDKATIDWEAQEDGFIAKLLVPDGTNNIDIGAPVAVLVEEANEVAAFKDFQLGAQAQAAASPAPAAAPAPPSTSPAPPAPAAPAAPTPQAAPAPASAPGDRIKASPYAKKLAQEAGVLLSGLPGSGPGGRIVAEDVLKAAKSPKAAPAALAPAAAAAVVSSGTFVDIPHTQIRRITAQRLLESKQTIPHYYLTVECQVDAMLKLREQINSTSAAGVKISVNDFIIKAAALALKKVPGVNSSWQKDFTRQYSNVDVSVAVQTPTGLLTPIVKDADKKGLGAISADVKTLAGKAKEGKLQPSEFMGGTFTISNLGMFGVKQFAAIVNPPQAAILAVGGTEKKVVLSKAGQYEQVSALNVTLSCDHRVIDGAMGAEWLQAFRGYLENPYTMLL